MDGYSVQEAASVLGVAEGRVWELLARGVLSGTPEGDSMRVFLKAQPGPIEAAVGHDEPRRTNGNGGSSGGGEASAFRELLTEFRNLTERYGQALLALGEARGEVAGLRSRVDLLEARLDLRVPTAIEATPVDWDEPAAPLTRERPARPPRPAPVRRATRPRKAPSQREAVAGFAEALARAQDPSPAELAEAPVEVADVAASEVAPEPVATDVTAEDGMTADLLAAEVAAEAPAEEPDQPKAAATAPDQAAAEAPAVAAEPEAPTYSSVVVEPDWFADGDFAWLDAAELEATGGVETTTPQEAAPTEAVTVEAAPADPDAGAETVSDAQGAEAAPADAAADIQEAFESEPEPEIQAASQTEAAIEEAAFTPEPEQAAEPAVAVEPGMAAEPELAMEPEMAAEPEIAAVPEAGAEPEIAAAPEMAAEAQLAAEAETMAAPAAQAAAAFESPADFEPWQPPEAAAPAPSEGTSEPEGGSDPPRGRSEPTDAQTMSAGVAVRDLEEEVMWLGAEPEPTVIVGVEARPEQRSEVGGWPAADAPTPPPTEAPRPPLAMTEDELARLALDEGWDESEVAAIRAMITPLPGPTRVDLPGATELHEAMAALEAVPVRSNPTFDASRQWAKPAPADDPPVQPDDWAFEAEPPRPPVAPPRSPTDVTAALRRSVNDRSWLRRRQGPAAAAYRRLRRLFPG